MDIFTPVSQLMQLMKDVLDEDENCEILQSDLMPLEYFLPYISTVLQDQLPEAARETLKVWLQLLHNCLTEAKSMLHRSDPPQRCLDCLMCNPGRLSKQIKKWKVLINYLIQSLQRDLSVIVSGREAVIAPVIAPVIPLMKDVIQEEENRHILQTELRPVDNLHILQTELRPVDNLLLDISFVFQDQQKAAPEALKIWLQVLHNSLTEANDILHRYGPSQRQVKEWRVLFNYLFQGLQGEFSIFAEESLQPLSKDEAEVSTTAHQIINRDPIPPMSAEESLQPLSKDEAEAEESEESTDESEESLQPLSKDEAEAEESVQPLSKDEAWMLFRRIAFKDNRVPMEIEEYVTNMADECNGIPLAITLVAAAMRGKTRVEEWETFLSSIKNADRSFPDTLHPQLYRLIRWSYDALPNSDVKNCFLYCALYPKDSQIRVQELVRMWIAEGLVRSKQENHLMDMAIGHSYVNLLVDRCFFLNATDEIDGYWELLSGQCIRVDHVIREMAIHIGEKEENCLLMEGQWLQNFPTIQDCKRMSLANNLPTELPCPKLVSLILSTDHSIEQLPLLSLTSLKVLHLHSSNRINSIPSSVGELKQLEFLSLQGLESIQDLPEQICHLPSLQFLDLSYCKSLQSLPSKIGELKNLKYLGLRGCESLKVIPHEISQLTSLSALDAQDVRLSAEAESEASIWRLKGLRNLKMLRISVTSGSKINVGPWLDMRHLVLEMFVLPDDMKNMRKLQSFEMWWYLGSSLPDYTCKFQHLQNISLVRCLNLRELSPLQRLPNLKCLILAWCSGLKELGIGNSGGFLMLEKLVLYGLINLESIAGASNNGVWNERTLPRLRILKIRRCEQLRRLPMGMDKLLSLSKLFVTPRNWRQIIWEDDGMKIHLEKIFREWDERSPSSFR